MSKRSRQNYSSDLKAAAMVDLPPAVTTLQAATAAGAAPGAAAALTPVQVAVVDASTALQTLNRAIQTNATVTDVQTAVTGTLVTLSTQLGDVTVALPQLEAASQQALLQTLIALTQTGKPITLGLAPGSPPSQGVLLLPVAPPSPVGDTTTQPRQTPTAAAPPLAVGETLPALVLPSDASMAAGNAPTALPASLPVAAPQIVSASGLAPALGQSPTALASAAGAQTLSGPPSAPQLTAVLPAQAPQGQEVQEQPVQSPTAPPAANTLASLLQTGNDVSLRVDAVLPPLASASSLPSLGPNQIVATVTGTGTDGQLILKAGDSTLFVKVPASAALGSTVVLTVGASRSSPLVTFPPIEPITFQALPQAMTALAQADPQVLQQIMATRLLQPNETLPGAMLLLFGAFKQGSVRGWLGDAATDKLLNMGKADLVASLSHDLGSAGQPAQDAVVGDWRSYPIPLFAQQQFQQLTLHVHDERGDAKRDGEAGTGKIRFVIDMTLSRLGAMQIDGFVQPKKLDMILRSETTLPSGMHNDLRLSYIKALGAVGYAGSLSFQVGRGHWLVMQRAAASPILT
jgi:hypothetical protein